MLTRIKYLFLGFIISIFNNYSLASESPHFVAAKEVETAEFLTFNGVVEAVNKGTASAQTSGRVIEVFFDIGDIVEKNAVLLRLENSRQTAEYESAEASIKVAQANSLAAAKAFARIKEVYSKKLVSKADFDNALSKRDATQAALDVAEARLKNARVQLEYTKIRAPYQGIVLERFVEVGETVNPGSAVFSGMSLESMRVVAQVPQKDIHQIRKFKHAEIITPVATILDIKDSNLTFFGQADPHTSTFKVRVKLPQIDNIFPGMYLKTRFQIGNRVALVIPLSSIVHRGEVTAVYLQNDSKDLIFRQIRTGRIHQNNNIEVLSGLKLGESVAIDPVAAKQIDSQH